MGIDHGGDAGVGRPQKGKPFLDRTKSRLGKMLVRAAALPEPAIVGDIEQPSRPVLRVCNPPRKDRFVANERS